MKLYRVILPVTDIEKAVTYYSAIFETPGKRVSPGRHYFNLDGTILAFYDPTADGDGFGEGWRFHEHQFVYISTSQLDYIHNRIKSLGGQKVLTPIESMPWGERLFYLTDAFACNICFVDAETVFVGD